MPSYFTAESAAGWEEAEEVFSQESVERVLVSEARGWRCEVTALQKVLGRDVLRCLQRGPDQCGGQNAAVTEMVGGGQ